MTMAGPAFTFDDDVSLCRNVRQNRALYDRAHRGHDDARLKDDIWNDISVKTGKSVYQCMRRWKNIKTTYIKSKKKLENGSTKKSDNNWSLSAYVSFLDAVHTEQKGVHNTITTSNVRNYEPKFDLQKNLIFESAARDNDLPSASTDTLLSASNSENTKEDKIAIILAKGLKERNEMLYNTLQKQMEILDNTSFTVTVQYDQNTASSARNSQMRDELSGEHNNYGSVRDDDSSGQPSPDDRSYYFAEKLARSKERNTILFNLLKQIEMLNSKSENTKSLDLFFKSVSVDIEDLCPRAIGEVKPKILKCVSEVREIYYSKSTASPNNPPCTLAERFSRPDEENAILCNLHKRMETVHNKLEIARSTDLFFKSISADMEDFCIRAIDEVKLRILKCVSEVKEIYSNREIPSPSPSDGNSKSNYSASHTPPTVLARDPAAPVLDAIPGQGYITYYNVPVPTVPVYCNEPSNFNQSYF